MPDMRLNSEEFVLDLKQQLRHRALLVKGFAQVLAKHQDDVLKGIRLDPGLRASLPAPRKFVLKARLEDANTMFVLIPWRPTVANGIPARSIQFYQDLYTEPTFRKKLKAKPCRVIEEFFGVSIPDNVKITVIEESLEERFVVIPYDFSKEVTGGGTTIYDHAYRAKGWGGKPKKTSLLSPCPITLDLSRPECQIGNDETYDPVNPWCPPVAKTADPIDFDCPGGSCSPLFTHGT